MNHLLSIEQLTGDEIAHLVNRAVDLKKNRKSSPQVLTGQTWALIFNKSSTRTRVSFEVVFANSAARRCSSRARRCSSVVVNP